MSSARTDCPSTASRGDGQQTRHESGQPCPMPQESTTRPAPRPDGHVAPMPSTCPPRSNRQSQPETARTSEEGEEEHEGRKGEKMRTCARLPAVLPSKSYIDRTPPQNGQPAPAEAPSLPTFSRPFLSLSILLLESLQNPGPFFARQQTNNGTPPACLDGGGAFTFSRPPRFSRNGLVPLLYHVRLISPFFTR